MKKVWFLWGILGLALTAGLLLAGCPQPTDEPPATHRVNFAAGGGAGSPPASQTVNAGTVITLPDQGNMTAPPGKTFNGWALGGEAYPAGSSYTVNNDVTFIAQWKDEESGVNLFVGEWTGHITTPYSDEEYAEAFITNASWTLSVGTGGSTVTESGSYAYAGNSATLLDGSGSPFGAAHIETGAGVLLLEITGGVFSGSYGEFTAYTPADQYTVTFDARGGSSSQSTIIVAAGGYVTSLPTAVRSGYVFDGWHTQINGGGSEFTVNTPVNDNITVYANWTGSDQYTVTFNAQGGSASQSTITVVAGGYVTSLPTATRSGYVFGGWYTQANGWGYQFTDDTPVNDNITVYANWTGGDQYTVTFDAQGGSASQSSISVAAGGYITYLPTATRNGYVFGGWYTQADGWGYQFTDDTPVNDNITVYANWTEGDQYTVIFDAQGGSASQSSISVAAGDYITNLPTATRSGYVFGGWYTQADGWGYQFTDDTPVNDNITVYANWTGGDPYMVIFDAQGGSVSQSSITVVPGEYITYLPTATMNGYTFDGWYTETGGGGSEFTTTTPVNEDITVYAKWTANPYTVTFDSWGGSASQSSITVTAGECVTTLPTATRSGYVFGGWFTQTNGWGSEFTAATPVNEDITVYAKWTVEYTVTFDAQGGSVSQSTITVNEGEYVTTLPTATRSTYRFDGWFTQTNGGGYQFTSGTAVYSDITVYAQWTDSGVNLREVGIYIGIISFAGNAVDLTAPIFLDYSGRNSLINTINSQYEISSQSGTALFYAVHRALNNLVNITTYPDKLESVNVVTFTDGLDNGSTGRSALNPIEDETFDTEADYATYVDGEIDNRLINGKSITAYSMGVRGNDVTNIPLFQSNLEKIASDGKAYDELTDYSQLEEAFDEIAENLRDEHRNTNFNMKTTLLSSGTKVRMTFDVTGTGSSDAAGSSKYIEGAITRTGTGANLSYVFENISYGGGLGSDQVAGPITGVINDSEVTFAFTGVEGYNPATDESTAKQWTMTSDTTDWQINSEYSISGATDVEVELSSSIIYLVLDASTSMNSAQISQVRSYVTAFISSIYDSLNN
jgi:uncharacterized repeat protein (TIGR02543 family)